MCRAAVGHGQPMSRNRRILIPHEYRRKSSRIIIAYHSFSAHHPNHTAVAPSGLSLSFQCHVVSAHGGLGPFHSFPVHPIISKAGHSLVRRRSWPPSLSSPASSPGIGENKRRAPAAHPVPASVHYRSPASLQQRSLIQDTRYRTLVLTHPMIATPSHQLGIDTGATHTR